MDNVRELPRRTRRIPKSPLSIVQTTYTDCQHRHVEVDEKLAEVTCVDCKAKLNPVAVLMRFAQDDSLLERRWRELQAQVELLRGRTRCKCDHCGKITPIRSRASYATICDEIERKRREQEGDA